jgi:mono/diheme cytochrome c family protein
MKISNLAIIATVFLTPILGQAQKGAATFQEQCVGCHGPDGRAQTDMGKTMHAADLTSSAVQKQSESQLSKIVKNGKGKMPSFDGKLSDDEIGGVVTYVKSLGKK